MRDLFQNWKFLTGLGTEVRGRRHLTWFLALCGAVFVAACNGPNTIDPGTKRKIDPAATGEVHGSVHTKLNNNSYVVSGLNVVLKDQAGAPIASTKTDVRGRYLFKNIAGGYYSLCWDDPGWLAGCAANQITAENNISYMNSQPIVADRVKGIRIVAGRVAFKDGRTPWYRDAFFGIDSGVTVVASDQSGMEIARTLTSPTGHYVMAGLPETKLVLRAEISGLTSAQIAVGASDSDVPITLNNNRPVIVSLTATPAQFPRYIVQAGARLNVTAEVFDEDGKADNLNYIWKPAPQNGEVVSSTGSSAVWQLDGRPGPKIIYLTVDDGQGGYATHSVSVNAGQKVTTLAGLVTGSRGNPVANADISINVQAYNLNREGEVIRGNPVIPVSDRTIRATTGQDGRFALADVPMGERYVVNINASGKVPVSRILNAGNNFAEYRLTDAFITELDPRRPETISDRRDREGASARQQVSVRLLNANALTTESNRPLAAGPVRAEIASLDLRRNEMPGDYTTLSDGELIGLKSFGAVNIDFFDAEGNALQLKKGEFAEVRIAAPRDMKDRPEQVPLWFYNEETGLWDRYESMARYDRESDSYVGRVDHFSAVNVDAPLPDTSCIRFLSDNLSTNLGLTAVFDFPSLTQSYTLPIDESLSVLRRIPPTEAGTTVRIFDGASIVQDVDVYQFDFASGQTPIAGVNGVFTFTTGAIVPGNFTLARPYDGCQTLSVRRTVPGSGDFKFLERAHGVGSDAKAQSYYKGLDPAMTFSNGTWSGGTHATLGDWWTNNGFSNAGVPNTQGNPLIIDASQAAYMNYNDLGFGRNMTIRKDTITGVEHVYAYVSNHADITVNFGANQNPLNAGFAAAKSNGFATVVMESTNYGGMDNVVTFFVYGGIDATAPLINSASLDGFGQKFIPGLCQVCHGGAVYNPSNVNAPTNLDLSLRPSVNGFGASFREFDLESYVFTSGVQGTAGLPAAEEAAFFKLNQLVKDSRPQPNIVDLIDGWYSGVSLNAAGTTLVGTPDYLKAPSGWEAPTNDEVFYTDVIGKSCRTCHIAFDGSGGANDISWHSEALFASGFSDFLVCDITSGNLMPHALMTYRNFWLEGMGSPYEPDAFAAYTGNSCN